MSGVWVKVHPDQVGGGSGTLDPAELLSDPVAVSNATAPASYTVKLTDGSQKKIWFLPGNTSTSDQAVYSVELSQGTLNGVMVGAGGCGGGVQNTTRYGGAGGAGGVIGQGAQVPVVLPVQGTATYTITVPPTTVSNRESYVWNGASATIAVEGQPPFASAMGGGRGGTANATSSGGSPFPCTASAGGSGGGGCGWPYDNDSSYSHGGEGLPGQGHSGGKGKEPYGGAGGGYGGPGEDGNGAGGAGFDLATALLLDSSDADTKSFIDMVSVDGWIAGGGATNGGSATAGGGVGGGGHAKDYTGAGGGGHSVYGKGGAGMVLLVTEV